MNINFRNENENTQYTFNSIYINGVKLYFSYETCVAFRYGGKLYISENVWTNTTGKHLNWLDNGDKKNRLNNDEFKKLLEETLEEAERESIYDNIFKDNVKTITCIDKDFWSSDELYLAIYQYKLKNNTYNKNLE